VCPCLWDGGVAWQWMPLDQYFRLDYMSSDSLYFQMAQWGVQVRAQKMCPVAAVRALHPVRVSFPKLEACTAERSP
jgi:hypothetical protein